MNRLGIHTISVQRTFSAVLVCLLGLSTPMAGYSQPGRTFTPPPPPPPFIPPRPPTVAPSPPINHQQNMQHFQQSTQRHMDQFRMNIQQDSINTRLNADANARMSKSSSGSVPRGFQSGKQLPKLANGDIIVTEVEPNTQCARLGLKKGDVLVSYGGAAIHSPQHLRDLTKRQPDKGRQLALVVIRNNAVLRFPVNPGRLGIVMREQKPGNG